MSLSIKWILWSLARDEGDIKNRYAEKVYGPIRVVCLSTFSISFLLDGCPLPKIYPERGFRQRWSFIILYIYILFRIAFMYAIQTGVAKANISFFANYYQITGQAINNNKSGIFFSTNVSCNLQDNICPMQLRKLVNNGKYFDNPLFLNTR